MKKTLWYIGVYWTLTFLVYELLCVVLMDVQYFSFRFNLHFIALCIQTFMFSFFIEFKPILKGE